MREAPGKESGRVRQQIRRMTPTDVFYHVFIDWGSTYLFDKFIKTPRCKDDVIRHKKDYDKAGFTGAVGSADTVNIILEKGTHRLKQAHLGGKSSLTCRTFNVVVNNRREILHTTSGYPARWNDKTLILFDEFLTNIQSGNILQDCEFELFEYNENKVVCKRKYKGCWIIVDNGYFPWPTIIPPFKSVKYRKDFRWSEWLESMRKDVECCFGILKGRWRILKTGIRLHGVECATKIFKTCCALHNSLLDIDGTNKGSDSDWLGRMGRHEYEDTTNQISGVLLRLNNLENANSNIPSNIDTMLPSELQQIDITQHPFVMNNVIENITEEYNASSDILTNESNSESSNVINMSQEKFRKKLVEHFNILFDQNKIVWPK